MDLLTPYLDHLAAAGNFNGSLLVAQGTRRWRRSMGLADAGQNRPLTSGTPLRIGSLSKSFTAAVVLRLIDAGRLQLDTPLYKHLPQLDIPAGITVAHLLRHRSGLGNHTALPDYWPARMQRHWPTDVLLADMLARPLQFAPGSDCAYSNTGYALLARLAEAIAQQPFAELLQQQCLQPLQLANTRDEISQPAPGAARGYWLAPQWQEAEPLDISNGYGAYNLSSTCDDLLRWWQALQAPGLLSEASRRFMFHADGEEGFGAGWYREPASGGALLMHSGDVNGFAAHLCAQPDSDSVVIVLSNLAQTEVATLADTLLALLHGQAQPLPLAAQPGGQLPAWTQGRYLADNGSVIDVSAGQVSLGRQYGVVCHCPLQLADSDNGADSCSALLSRVPEQLHFQRDLAGVALQHRVGHRLTRFQRRN